MLIPHLYPGLHLVVYLLVDLEVSLLHVPRLLGVERVRNAPADEHVELDTPLPVLLLLLPLLLPLLLGQVLVGVSGGTGRSGTVPGTACLAADATASGLAGGFGAVGDTGDGFWGLRSVGEGAVEPGLVLDEVVLVLLLAGARLDHDDEGREVLKKESKRELNLVVVMYSM